MRPRSALAITLAALLAGILPGCAAPEGFVVLAVSGDIRGEGPDRPGPACGRPLFDARYDLDARVVEVTERIRPSWTPRLVVAEDVREDDPANEGGCSGWPALRASRDGSMTWIWRLHGHEESLPIEVRDGIVRVENRTLAPGETHEIPVSFTWKAPWNASYAYEGRILVEHRGTWPASSFRTVEAVDWGADWRVDDGA
jgi:hypothetical protein